MSATPDDPYLWLEEVTGDAALAWVRAHNEQTTAELAAGGRFAELTGQIRAGARRRRPDPATCAGTASTSTTSGRTPGNPRGLWRRTTLESYREEQPDWEVLLDVDALAAVEGENWVWQGAPAAAARLRPGARGSCPAAAPTRRVVREFDLTAPAFVEDGFALPEAKSTSAGSTPTPIYVGTDFGPGSLTSSRLPPARCRKWRRGTRWPRSRSRSSRATPTDVFVYATHDPTPGFERDFVVRSTGLLPARPLPAGGRRAGTASTCPRTPTSTCTASGC